MTEKELIESGFRRIDVKADEFVSPVDWYHYEYIFGCDYEAFELHAYCSDEDLYPRTGEENDWYAVLWEIDERTHITNISDLKELIDLIYKIIDILYKNK